MPSAFVTVAESPAPGSSSDDSSSHSDACHKRRRSSHWQSSPRDRSPTSEHHHDGQGTSPSKRQRSSPITAVDSGGSSSSSAHSSQQPSMSCSLSSIRTRSVRLHAIQLWLAELQSTRGDPLYFVTWLRVSGLWLEGGRLGVLKWRTDCFTLPCFCMPRHTKSLSVCSWLVLCS